MRRGISLAFETIAVAIMVLIVIIVLSLIFREQIIKLLQLDGPCGQGMYQEYACYQEPPEGSLNCFQASRQCPDGDYCCMVG